MAKTVNKTFPVPINGTFTNEAHGAMKTIAASRKISVRQLIREFCDDGIAHSHTLDSLRASLELVSAATGRPVHDLVSGYALAGVTHHMIRLGLIKIQKEN